MSALTPAEIGQQFGAAAATYESVAIAQKVAVDYLSAAFRGIELPAGPILEIGCGTGLLSRQLQQTWPDRPLICSDISPVMLATCEQNLPRSPHLQFQVLNGATLHPEQTYAAIASSFALQWLPDPIASLQCWQAALLPGGWLLIAVPTAGSFQVWRQLCEQLQIPFTGHPLPEAAELQAVLSRSGQLLQGTCDRLTLPLPNARSFFRQLKELGATATAAPTLNPAQLRRLCRAWDQQAQPIEQEFWWGLWQKTPVPAAIAPLGCPDSRCSLLT